MDEFKFHNKIKNIFYYILFLFAFVCVGFTFNSSKVDAAVSVDIKDTIDYTNKKVSFDVKWGWLTVTNIQYCFGDSNCSNKTSIGVSSYDSIRDDGGDKVATQYVEKYDTMYL